MSKYGNIKQIRKSWHFNVQHVIIRDHFCSFTICYEPKIFANFRKLTKDELNLASNATVGSFQTLFIYCLQFYNFEKVLPTYHQKIHRLVGGTRRPVKVLEQVCIFTWPFLCLEIQNFEFFLKQSLKLTRIFVFKNWWLSFLWQCHFSSCHWNKPELNWKRIWTLLMGSFLKKLELQSWNSN